MGEPKLRFKADDGADFSGWEEKTLGELCAPLTYGMNAAATKFDGENRYIRITDIDDETHALLPNDVVSPSGELDDKYLVKKGDILLARTGASTGKSFLYHPKDGKLFYAGFLIKAHVLPSSDDYFIYSQTLTDRYWKWVKTASMRSGQPGINANEYASYSFAVPSLPEQRKIADFLSAVDAVIAAQQAEVDAWEQRKKGVMQKLFSQEVRFKADDGSDFPEWEEKKLGDVCTQLNMAIDPQANGDDEFVEYSMPAYDNQRTAKVVLGRDMSSARKIMPTPCVLINKLNVRKKRVWVIEQPESNAVCSTEFVPLTSKTSDLRFLGYLTMTDGFTNYLLNCSSGSSNSQKRVAPNDLLNYVVKFPSPPEQSKIADCLSSIDDVIAKAKAELAKWQELKKGLLQQMFV